MSKDENIRSWLCTNGYEDIAEMISEIMNEWKKRGKKTRRNWWEILAGDANGNSRKVAGRTFPVLRAAQIRHGKTVSRTAIKRNAREKRHWIWVNTRWSKENDSE